MTNREKINALLDGFRESQLEDVLRILQTMKKAASVQEEDSFFDDLYQAYQAAPPDFGEGMSFDMGEGMNFNLDPEEAAKMFGF